MSRYTLLSSLPMPPFLHRSCLLDCEQSQEQFDLYLQRKGYDCLRLVGSDPPRDVEDFDELVSKCRLHSTAHVCIASLQL